MAVDGIVLFAKTSGQTSFSSLYTIKRALNIKKVGHTGTLDSFADGLLVVCTGCATHLVKYITDFDKEYDAIIQFGQETDTLDPTGKVVQTSDLPTLKDLNFAVKKWLGENQQIPPKYSAIHVDGKRLSDLSREGKSVEIPKRKITVFNSAIIECRATDKSLCAKDEDKVLYAHIHFSVSKGTYIRSLARDIAYDCFSCAHLVALRRTRVGNFYLKDAVGYNLLPKFSIDSLGKMENESSLFSESVSVKEVNKELSLLCGFKNLDLKKEYFCDFRNGKKINESMFSNFDNSLDFDNSYCSVFFENRFCGLIFYSQEKFEYCFVRSNISDKNGCKR